MSVRTKRHLIKRQAKVILELSDSKKVFYIPAKNSKKCASFLEKLSEEGKEEPVAWDILAKDRIAQYKKAGLVLRGMRYREDISQRILAEKSGVTQNEISNIENGKRTVGEKIAKKLAKALHFDYRLLL